MRANPDFEQIRPYNDDEVPAAIQRIVQEKGFFKVVGFFFPEIPSEKIIDELVKAKTIDEFQSSFAKKLTERIIAMSITSLTIDGLENIDKNKNYMFISNHRDIVLDSSLLNYLLHVNGHKSTETGIGSNLLILRWITDLVKLNRTFIVKRNLPKLEFYNYSILLSKYIRHTITEKKVSIWIAQREGRTKDGFDKTQSGLLKMFNISGTKSFEENFKELNIVPVSISYEFEPCDAEKVTELYNRMIDVNFKKTKLADMMSMGKGMITPKGHVHYSIGKPLNEEIDNIPDSTNKNDKLHSIAELIDKKIYQMYRLTPINYAAASYLFDTDVYNDKFTKSDLDKLDGYMAKSMANMEGDAAIMRKMFLEIYAYPANNYERFKDL